MLKRDHPIFNFSNDDINFEFYSEAFSDVIDVTIMEGEIDIFKRCVSEAFKNAPMPSRKGAFRSFTLATPFFAGMQLGISSLCSPPFLHPIKQYLSETTSEGSSIARVPFSHASPRFTLLCSSAHRHALASTGHCAVSSLRLHAHIHSLITNTAAVTTLHCPMSSLCHALSAHKSNPTTRLCQCSECLCGCSR